MIGKTLTAWTVLALAFAGPAFAQGTPGTQPDTGVRDILNRAQNQSERRAVDDLINRLRPTQQPGQPGQPSAPAAAGQPPTDASAQTAAPPASQPATAPAVATPATVPVAPPAVAAPATPSPIAQPSAVAAPSPPPAPTSIGLPIGTATSGSGPTPTAVAAPPIATPSAPAAAPSQPVAATATDTQQPPATTVSAPATPPRAAGRQRRGLPPSAATSQPPANDAAGNVGAPIGPAAAFPTPIGPPPSLDAMMAKAPEIAREKGLPTVDIEVLFDFDSAEISPATAASLADLGKALSDPQLAGQKFVLAGHTDRKGRPSYNLALSERRSQAVRAYLVTQFRIPEGDLLARGFGHTRLKNPRNPTGAENRRVQIINFTSEMVRTQQRR